MPPVTAGDLVVLFDGTIDPPKHKWFLAAYVAEGWFLRLNSRPNWPPHFKLLQKDNPCLAQDCYVELNTILEFWEGEVAESLRYPDNHKGRLSDDTIRALIARLAGVFTLTPEEIQIIIRELQATL